MSDEASTAAAASRVDFVALKPGHKVGRYEILAVLGQGGFGITYRARDEQLGREVALKEYLPSALAIRHESTTVLPRSTDVAADFTWGRERFVAEGRTLATLHDAPAIVRVHDFIEANGTAYMVMELVRGETLEKRLERGPLGPAELDALLWPLLDGLEQVHAAGFLHRDIKPANIIIGPSGRPTLIDFGASRAAMAGRTTAMTAIFTPGFAAAEQFTSAQQGPWTDVYGMSATLYRALAGTAPPSAFDRMLDDQYKPLKVLAPRNFSAALLAGIDAGLAVRASSRPQSIADWRALLTGAATAEDATRVITQPPPIAEPPPLAAPTTAVPSPAPPRQSRTALYAGAAATVVVLLGAGGWFALKPSTSPSVQEMRTEDLARVLAERQKADAEAAEKRRLEEEAQKKVAADAAAKAAADAEVTKAEAARQKAEQELAKLKAQIEAEKKVAAERQQAVEADVRRQAAEEAQRKAEAEMAALKQAEEDARKKAATDAETKRLADEALAKAQAERAKADADAKAKAEAETKQKAEADTKTRAEAEARAKAEADAKAKAEAEAADKKAAEAAETGLKLAPTDRQRLQVALTSLGFDTRGTDGAFGPRTREMIAAWQKARNLPPTGFLNASQQQQMQREGATAIAKFDDEEKKKEEEKKKAEEEAKKKAEEAAKAQAAAAPPATTPPAAGTALAPAGGPFDGSYGGSAFNQGGNMIANNIPRSTPLSVQVVADRLTGQGTTKCGSFPLALAVSPTGDISGSSRMFDGQCQSLNVSVRGKVSGNSMQLSLSGAGFTINATLTKGAAAPPAVAAATPAPTTPPPPAAPAATVGPFDGSYGGGVVTTSTRVAPGGSSATFLVAGETVTGTIQDRTCGGYAVSFKVSATGELSGSTHIVDFQSCQRLDASVTGKIVGNQLQVNFAAFAVRISGSLTKGAAAPSAGAAPAATAPAASTAGGTYKGSVYLSSYRLGGLTTVNVTMSVSGSTATAEFSSPCGSSKAAIAVGADGSISGTAKLPADAKSCPIEEFALSGKIASDAVQFAASASTGKGSGTLKKAP